VYCAVVINGYSRLVVGHATSDVLPTELVVDAFDNAIEESFFASMQTGLLDRRTVRDDRDQLANAILDTRLDRGILRPSAPPLNARSSGSRRDRQKRPDRTRDCGLKTRTRRSTQRVEHHGAFQ
jgi:hypothetical protein